MYLYYDSKAIFRGKTKMFFFAKFSENTEEVADRLSITRVEFLFVHMFATAVQQQCFAADGAAARKKISAKNKITPSSSTCLPRPANSLECLKHLRSIGHRWIMTRQ
jgi:hypothetical protein